MLALAVCKESEGYVVIFCAYGKRTVVIFVTELFLNKVGGNRGGVYEDRNKRPNKAQNPSNYPFRYTNLGHNETALSITTH